MSDEERAQSGFMQIFRELLNYLSPEVTSRCEHLAQQYRSEQESLIRQAEQNVYESKQQDIASVVAEHDGMLVQQMETLFQHTQLAREHILAQEKPLYQQILCLARSHSHAFWSPGTEIAHPADKPVDEWSFSSLSEPQEVVVEEHQLELFQQIFTPKQEQLNVGV